MAESPVGARILLLTDIEGCTDPTWRQTATMRALPSQYDNSPKATAGCSAGPNLASEAVLERLHDRLPDGFRLVDLGKVTVQNFGEPIQAYLIEAHDTPLDPAIRSPMPAADAPDTTVPDEAPATLRVTTLGEFRVEYRGRVIRPDEWGGSKARQIFKQLISRRTHRLSREEVLDTYFADSGAAASSTYRSTLSRLRAVLEPGVDARDSVVQSGRDGLALRPDAAISVDADEFERLIRDSQQADDPLPRLEAASEMYGGDYLPDDLFDEWASNRREALRSLWTRLQRDLARLREARGDVHGAAAAHQTLLARDGCDEQAARDLMLLRARHGEAGEALRVFQRLVVTLRHVLSLGPSSETVALCELIAAGEIAAAGPTRAARTAAPDRPRRHLAPRPRRLQPAATESFGASLLLFTRAPNRAVR